METQRLKKVNFMNQSQYDSATKSKDQLYLVEFEPKLNVFPDYSTGITISAGTEYVVGSGGLPKTGWFRIGFTSTSWHGRDPQLVIKINGQEFYNSYFCCFTMIYLTEGDTFSCNSTYRCDAKFFPTKNV